MQKITLLTSQINNLTMPLITGFLLMFLAIQTAWGNELSMTEFNFSALTGDKVQIVLEMTGTPTKPQVFHTNNPARIALDFSGVRNALKQKNFAVNTGAVRDVYVIEAAGRTRVIINLVESVPYESKVEGNKVLITLNETKLAPSAPLPAVANESVMQEQTTVDPNQIEKKSIIARLLPQQVIQDIDFKRGAGGEGLLLVKLAHSNTVIDTREKGGRVILKFLNTRLPKSLRKRFDVSDFATPIQKIEAVSRGANTIITITPTSGHYDYSTFQEEGMLTVDFRPMTRAEKKIAQQAKFPYSGDKLSLNFQDIDVRSVLQILADFTELNIIASEAVAGNVTLRLNDVPWDQALDLILKANGLAKREAGNVILVAPTAQIIKLEEEELAAKKIVEELEPLRTEYIQINYAKAEDINLILLGGENASNTTATPVGKGNSNVASTGRLLSLRGVTNVDPRTNVLIIKDTAKKLEAIRALIQKLDISVRQVMIEARIVNADKRFAKDIGMRFGIGKAAAVGSGTSFALGPRPTVGGLVTQDITGTRTGGGVYVPSVNTETVTADDNKITHYLVDLAAAGTTAFPPAALGMTLARAADYVLNLEISALEGENRGELISNPRVLTSDRMEAVISQGVQIPYQSSTEEGVPRTELIDAVLELRVTPQITPNGSVIMDLAIKNDAANEAGGINKEEVKTTVEVKDGETVVLGGIYAMNTGKQVTKVPFFGDLPVIGILFRNTQDSERKKELLVFITPKVVKNSLTLD
jgi:type IV pilus assembly protein PilQ